MIPPTDEAEMRELRLVIKQSRVFQAYARRAESVPKLGYVRMIMDSGASVPLADPSVLHNLIDMTGHVHWGDRRSVAVLLKGTLIM